MKKLRLGVLGVSKHFVKRIVLPLQSSECVELYAIGSRDEVKASNAAKQFGFVKSYGSYLEVLKDINVDFVYIPLANSLHYQYIKLAADFGKPILCEKPLTLNHTEALDAISYCKAKNVPILEGFMYKFHPQWLHIKDFIRSQQLGEVQHISITFSNMNVDGSNIRNIPQMGGGALMDVGCYALSLPRFLLEIEPVRVISLMKIDDRFGVDSLTSGILDFGGARCTFNVSTQSEAYQRVEIIGKAGSITVPLPFNVYNDIPSSIIISTSLGQRTVMFPICDQYNLMFEAYARHLQGLGKLEYDSEDAVQNMVILDAVRESNKTGEWVTIS